MSPARPRVLLAAAAVALAACGDDGATPADAAIDGPTRPFVRPTPVAVPLSATGPDQLQAAVAGPAGSVYAAGFAAAGPAAPRFVVVVKLTAAGALDPTFGGGDGVATTTLDFRGDNGEVTLAVEPGGALVVAATVAHAGDPDDHDVAVARLTADGAVDRGFGDGGVRVLDLTTATDDNGVRAGPDAARGLAIDPTRGAIYVLALSRAAGTLAGEPRTDTDVTVVKLGRDGAIDAGFGGGDGRFTYDVQLVTESARGIAVRPDGSVLVSGYANTPALGSAQPLLLALDPTGALVPGFGTGGVVYQGVLARQAEVYNLARQGQTDQGVTCGYGRQAGDQNDWLSLRFDLTTGARDPSWGGQPHGAVLIDPTGAMIGDNCYGAFALPAGRTLLVGSAGPVNVPALQAGFAVLTPTGQLDPWFDPGVHVYDLAAGGLDQFWGAAVSGDHAIVVGYAAVGAVQTEAGNDDAYALVVPLP